ncbi:phage tail protein I [Photobacterium damselae]|uniref:phage tail protein I n=1 Tax=Photobacterium damselae TaxID=38293 RepID=UPI0040678754
MIPPILKQDIKQRTIGELTRTELQSLKDAILSLQILDVDNVHPTFLPWLAWWFRADEWNDEWPVDHQRQVVKSALILFRYKGTQWAVLRAVSLLDFEASIVEWHEMRPRGTNGTFKLLIPINTGQSEITSNTQLSIKNSVERNKRGSQHWSVNYINDADLKIYVGAYKSAIYDITISSKPPNPDVIGKIKVTPYVTTYDNIEIKLNE